MLQEILDGIGDASPGVRKNPVIDGAPISGRRSVVDPVDADEIVVAESDDDGFVEQEEEAAVQELAGDVGGRASRNKRNFKYKTSILPDGSMKITIVVSTLMETEKDEIKYHGKKNVQLTLI